LCTHFTLQPITLLAVYKKNQLFRSLHTKKSHCAHFTHQTIILFAIYTPKNLCAKSLHTKTSLSSQFTHQIIIVHTVYTTNNHCSISLHTKQSTCSQFTHKKLLFSQFTLQTFSSLEVYTTKITVIVVYKTTNHCVRSLHTKN
jgi:hypothetical protein